MTFQKPSHTFTKIHLKALHTNNFKILFALSFTVFINTLSFSQDIPEKGKSINRTVKDSLVPSVDSLDVLNTSEKIQDTITKDSIKPKKDLLENIVKYHAKDYTTFSNKKQKLYLYNEAKIDYGDMNITAGSITIDYNTNTVYAVGITDSIGAYSQKPVFTQGSNVVEPDSIVFNTETQKALIYNSKTEQGEGTVISELTKKENDSVYFVKDAKYTTASNLEDPEYYIKLRKAKIVPGKKIVTGLANLFIYDVPTPLGLPFGFFPQSETQTSGVIIPTFGEQNTRGYFLQNGGYYFAINDYVDLAVLGDYYTNGSYGLRLENKYKKRYKYSGNIGFRYENLITSERGFSDYAKNTIYNLRWSHSQDSKANPNSRFSASVNLGSSSYYQQSVNQVNVANFLNNTLSSSVSYSKTFQGEPQVNYSVTATHSQNTNTEEINMTLPTFQGSVGRVYPFASKNGSKKGIIQNINLQYNIRGENRISTTDSLFFKKEMFDEAKAGFQHSIPISTNFKLFKYFSASASSSFNEVWTFKTVDKTYDTTDREVVTETVNGFDAFRTYNFSTSLGTTIYGMFNREKEGKDVKLKAIRHVIRPSISYNINPAFDKYYDTYEVVSADGLTTSDVDFTRFEESIFGTPNKTFSSSMGISVSNNLEAKVKDRDSTATEDKKITIFNNLNFSTSYNFAGDSLKWSPVRVSGGTQLFKNKMSINFGATLDPYALDNNNTRIDTYNIDNGGSLFRLTNANMNASWSFSSKDGKNKDKDSDLEENRRSGGRADDLFGVSQDFSNQQIEDKRGEKEEESSELYNFKIPWSFRVAYAVNYGNSARQNEISSHSLMFSGDIELSTKWSVGGSSGYDLKNAGFTYTQLRFERDLLSWRMNFSWVPFSTRSSWNFFIGIKSSILSDLKYEKRRQADIQL
ncbi:LPS-assembly protein LptD [Algibacter amylolyticus]|uniref:LPS-assembly protein LptD n=1 Tax=Algibacter amylolyticus TaxID=1608400 RepID=A0A5M7AUZ7_9FLAO|nr:putative LPS assembly protein LptD [Algibacter amylolyticus]KAA5821162.1 LPS-assembly protein LptD [Algibacter amylolyticus]MBB5269807.1 lipopolysaccharide assembly outer membrane protein LptD (OstA) [Algibacter amylolyticus]TSJ72108.1 LPS-assembly protein LptD [Algibacter amylolyticus]